MAIIQRSAEYRKQSRSFFLTNIAAVRKQLTGVTATSGAHTPTIMVIVPTTTSVTTPGVSASGNVTTPTGVNDAVSLAVFEEDFSTYTDTTAWRDNQNDWYANTEYVAKTKQHIDTAITDPGVSSSQTLRYEWPANPAPCFNSSVTFSVRKWQDGRVLTSLSPLVRELWIEMRVRFDDAWDTNPDPTWQPGDALLCSGNPDHKLIRAFVAGQGQVNHFGLKDGTNLSSLWTFHALQDPAGQSQGGTSIGSKPFYDNQWHEIRCHFKQSTNESTPDGRVFISIDGTRLTVNATGFTGDDITTIAQDPGGSGNLYDGFKFIWFGLNRNHESLITQKMWWSRVRIYDADPEWAGV